MIRLADLEIPGTDQVLAVSVTERCDGSADPRGDRCVRTRWQRTVIGAQCATVAEVHGVGVLDVRGTEPHHHDVPADALVTDAGGPPIALWAGDCAAFVLVSGTTVVGAHAGWRGLAGGMIDLAVDALCDATAADRAEAPRPMRAVVGPLIHPCCYEFGLDDAQRVADGVGADVEQIVHRRHGATFLDPPAAIRMALTRRGVDLVGMGGCTGCDDRWFSHRVRRDAGRHALVAQFVSTAA